MNILESSFYVTAKISPICISKGKKVPKPMKKQALRIKMKCSHIRRNNYKKV